MIPIQFREVVGVDNVWVDLANEVFNEAGDLSKGVSIELLIWKVSEEDVFNTQHLCRFESLGLFHGDHFWFVGELHAGTLGQNGNIDHLATCDMLSDRPSCS